MKAERQKENAPQVVAAQDPPAQAKQPGGGAADKQDKGKPAGKDAVETPRKIKYTADVKLICADFPKAEEGMKEAIKKHKAIVAHSETSGSPGSPRSGSWRVRVPVAGFDDFRDAILKLGEVEKNTADSEDITDEYYDLENHIKNKLAEEDALRKLLEKNGNDLQTILTLREKLNQIRDYINRQEGRLRVLANLTDLTTITVTIREKQKYDPAPPPEIAETPTFGMRVDRTFGGTWDAFVGFVQLVILAAIAIAPWLAFAVVLVTPLAILVRRMRKPTLTMVEIIEPTPPPPAAS